MSEHVHKWVLYEPDDREKVFAECLWGWEENGYVKQCDAMLDEEEIHRRLNAMERLKKLIADLQDANDGPNEMGGPFVALSVITAALEDAPE